MRRAALLIIALWAAPSLAANEGAFPLLLHSTGCANAFDTVSPTAFDRYLQMSGSPDAFCDFDYRVRQTAISSTTLFGPISVAELVRASGGISPLRMVRIRAFGSTVAPGGGTWDFRVLSPSPIDTASFMTHDVSPSIPGQVLRTIDLGNRATLSEETDDAFPTGIPGEFYIQLTLGTATSWTGTLIAFPLY